MAAILRLALVATFLAFPMAAWAHGLRIDAAVEGGDVVVEATYSNGRAAASAAVRVLDGSNALLLEGVIGAEGSFAFAVTEAAAAGGVTIEVDDGAGHDGYFVLTPADLAAGGGS